MSTSLAQLTPEERTALVNLNHLDPEAFGLKIGLADFLTAEARRKAADLGVDIDAPGIARVAGARAWNEARRYFQQPVAAAAVANYLGRFGTLWADRLVENAAKGRPLPPVPALRAAPVPCGAPLARAPIAAPAVSAEPADPLLAECVSMLATDGVQFMTGSDPWPLQFCLGCGGVVCQFHLVGPQDRLYIFGYLPMRIPQTQRIAVGMRLLEVNWAQAEGGFEMDPATGTLRFCVSLSRREAAPARIRELLGVASGALREHAADLLRLALTE